MSLKLTHNSSKTETQNKWQIRSVVTIEAICPFHDQYEQYNQIDLAQADRTKKRKVMQAGNICERTRIRNMKVT